jgi:DNA-directed RNA polymerase specialized sigma24 family protein
MGQTVILAAAAKVGLRKSRGCLYKQIATITSRPISTVMSGLAPAR